MIDTLDLQVFLFEKETSRIELMNYVPKTQPAYRIAVYRNHSFELIEHTIKPYLEYGGIGAEFFYSDYDDSLSFINLDVSADLIVLWLDLSRYTNNNVAEFVDERIKYLQSIYKKNILFVPFEGSIDFKSNQVVQYPIGRIKDRLGDKYIDLRMEPFSGTKLNHTTCLEISRDLGLNYIPALLRPNLKGIVVDLDNTLYKGVLGEDGVDGVVLTAGHKRLQTKLKELSQQGFFLSIASKNDERDVFRLLEERSDFPLKKEDFVKICASWDSKADSITSIAKTLNINTDSLLFIDDNMGEIVSVLGQHPSLNILWAKDDANLTHSILCNYPGLLKLNIKKEDSLRKADTMANEKRQKMLKTLSREDYIKKLNMQLTFEIDNQERANRIAELANKTNQFIFSYQRYSLQQVENLMSGEDSTVVSISLKDNLSDSGIIGVVMVRNIDNYGLLEECFVSCRALGRGIDKAIVLGAMSVALNKLNLKSLKVDFIRGERNIPAEKFKDEHLLEFVSEPKEFTYELPKDLLTINIE